MVFGPINGIPDGEVRSRSENGENVACSVFLIDFFRRHVDPTDSQSWDPPSGTAAKTA
jgi:hypothetical protein